MILSASSAKAALLLLLTKDIEGVSTFDGIFRG